MKTNSLRYLNKLGKFAAACAAVLCAFGANVARADALVPSGGDDTAAILDAITNATEGATVELGQGTFLLSSTLKFSRNVRLVGAGADQPWMAGATDLRGNPRICDDRVDIGCYEVRLSGLMLIVR